MAGLCLTGSMQSAAEASQLTQPSHPIFLFILRRNGLHRPNHQNGYHWARGEMFWQQFDKCPRPYTCATTPEWAACLVV
jgi:hypothetical protein